MNNLVAALIAQGIKKNAEFTNGLIEIQKRVENTKQVQAISELKEVTGIMQNVDDFTLFETQVSKEEREQMKDVDFFISQKVGGLEERVAALETTTTGGKE